ncbi:hypothetical protein ACWDA3_51220 [Nonomuraea rubra]
MNPLKLAPAQWRALRYLGTFGATATRAGIRTTHLRERTGACRADLTSLAELRLIVGRLHQTEDSYPVLMQTVDNPRLRLHLTRAGKHAAKTVSAALRVLTHLDTAGPLPVATVQHGTGVGDDVLTGMERHGLIESAPGDYLSWKVGGYFSIYGPPRTAGPFGCDPCWSCRTRPPDGARIWCNSYGDLYCDPCARRNAGVAPSALLRLTSRGHNRVQPYLPEEQPS